MKVLSVSSQIPFCCRCDDFPGYCLHKWVIHFCHPVCLRLSCACSVRTLKLWCQRSVSVVCCRCACTSSPNRGVLSRHRPELSWHNFCHCIGKEVPGLELHVPTHAYKNPGQIPRRVRLPHLFLLSLAITIACCIIFAQLCFKTLLGNIDKRELF